MPSPTEPTEVECQTCRKRAEDYTELQATGVKLIGLGMAYCQECGSEYKAFAEESEDD